MYLSILNCRRVLIPHLFCAFLRANCGPAASGGSDFSAGGWPISRLPGRGPPSLILPIPWLCVEKKDQVCLCECFERLLGREVQKGASHFVAQNDKIDKPIIAVKLTNPVNRFTNGSVAGKEHRAGQQFCHFFTLYRLADQSIMCAGRQTPSHLLLVNPEFCGLMPHRRRCKMFHCFGWLP